MVDTKIERKQKSLNEFSGVRAIVLDDDHQAVEQLSASLREHGYEVLGFTDPREALMQIEHFKPHVFLTDTEMPKMSGVRVLEAIKDSFPEVPVIFVSVELSKDVLIKAVSFGVFGVLESPFEPSELKRFCESAVLGKRAPNADFESRCLV